MFAKKVIQRRNLCSYVPDAAKDGIHAVTSPRYRAIPSKLTLYARWFQFPFLTFL
jgi:hypothetical protein